MPKRLTTPEFIEKVRQIHGDKYDYSKVEYVSSHADVCIICPKHGEFWQRPTNHLNGKGCPKCAREITNNCKRFTKEQFIDKAKQIHGDKYDYSKVEYINNCTKVCIICPEHGEFWQRPSNHLNGEGCHKCGIINCCKKHKYSTKEFIEKAQKIHGDKYDYSKVQYINGSAKVCISCPIHGDFWQKPSIHLTGCGCPKCAANKLKILFSNDSESFIEKARNIHGNKYDYSKVEYINNHVNVCIICPEHGKFWQMPHNHLNGKGCPKCGGNFMSQEYFIEKAKQVHGTKYDYSKIQYVDAITKVCIICPEHGEFWQAPANHLSGQNCPKCSGVFMDRESFIEKAKKIHGNKYDYSKVEYINNRTKVCIVCPQHGEFWQSPSSHLRGYGCSKCNMSHLERDVMFFLERHNIEYEYQKRFEWLGMQSLDFYLPRYKIAIECQGIQHFEPVKHFGGENELKDLQERDKRKKQLCEQHNIRLRYYK